MYHYIHAYSLSSQISTCNIINLIESCNDEYFITSTKAVIISPWSFGWLVGCLVVWLVGWFDSRITQKQLNWFPHNSAFPQPKMDPISFWCWSGQSDRCRNFSHSLFLYCENVFFFSIFLLIPEGKCMDLDDKTIWHIYVCWILAVACFTKYFDAAVHLTYLYIKWHNFIVLSY